MEKDQKKPKRIRSPEHAAQIKAWKARNRELINEQARARRSDPEKRAHERELERIRRAKNRDERNTKRRVNRTDYQKTKERVDSDPLFAAEWRENKREQMRRLRADKQFLIKELETKRLWRLANPGKASAHQKKWRDNPKNIGKVRAQWARRRLVIKQQTPAWASIDAIAEIYACCPPGYHVDHIIPLRGKLVSGLHIETNLQYLPDVENLRKANRFSNI